MIQSENQTNKYKVKQLKFKRTSLLKFVLVSLFIISFVYGVINFIFKCHNNYIFIGTFELAVASLTLILLFYYHKTKNCAFTTNITVFLITAMLIVFLTLAGNEYYAFYWISIYPPLAYFLLERKKANLIIGLFCAYMLLFMLSDQVNWGSDAIKIDSIINITGATAGLIVFIRYFDISRTEALNALKEKNEALELLTVTDFLTGIFNRIKLDEVLNDEIKKASTGQCTFSIIMSDLDDFKTINDNYGHLKGDAVLIDVAQILKKSCRDTDIVGRWGGEEFLIVCSETDKTEAENLCQKLINDIFNHCYSIEEKVTMSFGITEYIIGDSPDTLLKRADRALYKAKYKGKICFETL